MSTLDKLKTRIKAHEGLRLKLYKDSLDISTIGYGRNLEANGISHLVADIMFEEDFVEAVRNAMNIPEYAQLNEARRGVLIEMVFNMGYSAVMKFVNTRAAMARGDFEAAANGMLASKWARQVHTRANTLAEIMRTGQL